MARKKRAPEKQPLFDDLEPHTKQAIGAVFFVVLGVYFTLALFGYAGVVGDLTRQTLSYLLGGSIIVCVFDVSARRARAKGCN